MTEQHQQINGFNLRVYGLWLQDDAILLSHESRFNMKMVKFPGGGLEKGEGLEAALMREFQEELGIDIHVGELFYVNKFFQQSAFRKDEQLISFYFFVKPKHSDERTRMILTSEDYSINTMEEFRWHSLPDLNLEEMTFPIDQAVVVEIKKAASQGDSLFVSSK